MCPRLHLEILHGQLGHDLVLISLVDMCRHRDRLGRGKYTPTSPSPAKSNTPQICACAPALKPLIHKPILRMTSRISSKLSSVLRSRGSNSQSSADKASSTNNHNVLRFNHGDEEFSMLQRSAHSDKSAMQVAYIPTDSLLDPEDRNMTGLRNHDPWASSAMRRHSGPLLPPLHIVKRQSLEQEISWIDPGKPTGSRERFDF